LVELVEHRWNKRDRYMEGVMIALRFGEVLDGLKGIEFRQSLYTVDELRGIYASVAMTFEKAFHGNGRPKAPTEAQFETSLPRPRTRRAPAMGARSPAVSTAPRESSADRP
jgi:hypothetical protein